MGGREDEEEEEEEEKEGGTEGGRGREGNTHCANPWQETMQGAGKLFCLGTIPPCRGQSCIVAILAQSWQAWGGGATSWRCLWPGISQDQGKPPGLLAIWGWKEGQGDSPEDSIVDGWLCGWGGGILVGIYSYCCIQYSVQLNLEVQKGTTTWPMIVNYLCWVGKYMQFVCALFVQSKRRFMGLCNFWDQFWQLLPVFGNNVVTFLGFNFILIYFQDFYVFFLWGKFIT